MFTSELRIEVGLIQRRVVECENKEEFIAILFTMYNFLSNQKQFQHRVCFCFGVASRSRMCPSCHPYKRGILIHWIQCGRHCPPCIFFRSREDGVEMIERRKKKGKEQSR